jgi:endoribonuclease LACTB2
MNIFNIGDNSINLYLIDSGSHRLLIDSGFPNRVNDIGREMKKTGWKIRDIDYLLVTHFHIDHAGAVQELKDEGVTFVLMDIQQNSIKAMEDMAIRKWRYKTLSLDDVKILTISGSRDFLKQLNIQGEIISTPGHTDDSISLVIDSGEAFTGDLLAYHLLMEMNSVEDQSWKKIQKLGARTVYPSHSNSYQLI